MSTVTPRSLDTCFAADECPCECNPILPDAAGGAGALCTCTVDAGDPILTGATGGACVIGTCTVGSGSKLWIDDDGTFESVD